MTHRLHSLKEQLGSSSSANEIITVVPTGTVGAEVRGLDLSCARTESEIAAIKRAWYAYDVLIFRGQHVDDAALVKFSKYFGELDPPPNQGAGRKSPQGFPELYVVSNVLGRDGEPIGALGNGEANWHTDMSYESFPPDASMLFSLEIPPTGGDTWFCSMRAAFKALPDALRQRCLQLEIKHDGTYDSGNNLRRDMKPNDDPTQSVGAVHPLVILHPESGEPALYLGRRRNAFIVGMSVAESEALLEVLWKYATLVTYRHRWRVGDLVLWDNRTTMHRRDEFDPNSRRVMHRSQIKCTVPPIPANPQLTKKKTERFQQKQRSEAISKI